MLVLSRKEAEKVLFPSLGISVEVTRVHGKTVRLGIDAPDQIRIIRAELEENADLEIKPSNSGDTPGDIRKFLDAANLAIHLAQNQLRQRLNENAEFALDQALECLDQLEHAAAFQSDLDPVQTPVRESKPGYHCRSNKIALIVHSNGPVHHDIQTRISELGYRMIRIDDGKSLIQFLRDNDQPDLVLTVDRQSAPTCNSGVGSNIAVAPGLRMFGVGSLQKIACSFSFGGMNVSAWYANSTDAQAMATCFGT